MGLILLDSSLTPIAFNREAVSILNYANDSIPKQEPVPRLPVEILESARKSENSDGSNVVTYITAGKRRYVCQSCSLIGNEGLPSIIIAILLHRNSTASEAISEVAIDFHLTERETQALSGICLGLSSKELAKRMDISPNTVKAFLRIIMVKMGVTTRAAVVAKILERNARAGVDTSAQDLSVQRAAGMRA